MRILIVTQKMDRNDSVLGFFHSWVTEFAPRFESVRVVCLEAGEHHLPRNVSVFSLGKESGRGRARSLVRFLHYIAQQRGAYDAVFVHMNPEYVLLGGLLWRLMGKKVVLWYNHPAKNLRLTLAAPLAHVLCYTSPFSASARYRKAVRMPVGIDTTFFSPGEGPAAHSILSLGRISPYKKVHVILATLMRLRDMKVEVRASIIGDAPARDTAYAEEIRALSEPLRTSGKLVLLPGVRYQETALLFRRHEVFINLSDQGNFDKTLLEAASCGALLLTNNEALRGFIPPECMTLTEPQAAAEAAKRLLALSDERKYAIRHALRAYVKEHHSLDALATRLKRVLS